MPIRRPRGPKPALRHVVFLEAMERHATVAAEQQPLEAAFLTLRLFDEWIASGAMIAEPVGQALTATRKAVERIGQDSETRTSLQGIVDAIVMLQEPDAQPVLPRIFAYAGLLERRGALVLAADAYQTVSKYADATAHSDIAYDALMRHAFCLRTEGSLDVAARSYEHAGALAARERDRSRVLYSRIGVAKVVWARGDLPAADAALQAVATEASGLGDARLHAVALHDCAGIASSRNDIPRAVRLAFESFREQVDETEKERVLNDLANFLSLSGAFDTARHALTLMERGARLQDSRWVAQGNLMNLGTRQGSETMFEQYRRALDGEPLPERRRAVFLLDCGRGFALFGRTDEAVRALLESSKIATRLGLHQLEFEVSAATEDLERVRRDLERNRPAPSAAPDDIGSYINELLEDLLAVSS
jgi:hypothetical protein